FDLVALRRLDGVAATALWRERRGRWLLAGVAIAALLSLPIVNLAAPLVAAAFMLHLVTAASGLAASSGRDPSKTRSNGGGTRFGGSRGARPVEDSIKGVRDDVRQEATRRRLSEKRAGCMGGSAAAGEARGASHACHGDGAAASAGDTAARAERRHAPDDG